MSDSPLSAAPVRPAGESHSPFRPLTIIALVLAAVFALSAMAALNAFAPELGPEWVETAREAHTSASGLPFAFVVYERGA